MTSQAVEDLRQAIRDAADFLGQYGDTPLAERVLELDAGLARGDWRAVSDALAESTGSMGSLNDRYLSPANQDPVTESEAPAVNARLRALVARIRDCARAVPAAMPITPFSNAALAVPAEAHLGEYVAALERGWSPDNHRPAEIASDHLAAITHNSKDFLARMDDREAKGPPITLLDGTQVRRLPGITRWIWDDGFCGSIGFRWQPGTSELPPHVPGHIGFSVVPWRRRKGHATRALGLMLQEARAAGLDHVELVAAFENVASQAVIAANAGLITGSFTKDAAHGGGTAFRFRIRL